jgi:hypothetical protein
VIGLSSSHRVTKLTIAFSLLWSSLSDITTMNNACFRSYIILPINLSLNDIPCIHQAASTLLFYPAILSNWQYHILIIHRASGTKQLWSWTPRCYSTWIWIFVQPYQQREGEGGE